MNTGGEEVRAEEGWIFTVKRTEGGRGKGFGGNKRVKQAKDVRKGKIVNANRQGWKLFSIRIRKRSSSRGIGTGEHSRRGG